MDLSITGGTVAGMLSAIVIGIIAIIVVMRSLYAQRSANVSTDAASQSSKSPLDARTKYPWADAFKYSGTFFNLGLALALGLTILAFSWTQYEEEVYIPDDALVFDEEIEIEPPRTAEPPPPPPPPPPPVIEEVPDETVLEEEEGEFVD
ncbi:MAG: energy transducer TonB, partial [Phaeodactylibacter sp.]|nr:energy transducer TonB [Phaeodactylibacter sp.]